MVNFLRIFNGIKLQNAQKWADSCAKYLPMYGITTTNDILYFLANILNESGALTKFEENLNYKSADRLVFIYKTAFDPDYGGQYNPDDYVEQPQKLANLVYNDNFFPKKGLGNYGPNEGWIYRGRGAIQITGKNLYKMVSKETGIDFVSNPDLLATPDYAIIGACVYWKNGNISRRATSLLQARQIVAGQIGNPNPIGFPEVTNWYNKIKQFA